MRQEMPRARRGPLQKARILAARASLALTLLTTCAACSEPPAPPPAATGSPAATAPVAPTASAQAAQAPQSPAAASPAPSAAPAPPGDACSDRSDAAIFISPERPTPSSPLRVVAVASRPLNASLVILGPDGAEVARHRIQREGPPAWWLAEIPSPKAGSYKAVLGSPDRPEACEAVAIEGEGEAKQPRKRAWGAAWPVTAAWGEATENFYSAWVEKLFDAPLEEQLSWPALHDVLRDRERNILHNHLAMNEDEGGPKGIAIDPDCADLPYYLRAYFAWKNGLPFGFSACTRGGSGGPPTCLRWHSNQQAPPSSRRGPAASFGEFLRIRVADTVHSGTGRVAAEDNKSDYYTVPLTLESVRPGAVYADPYGHILVVARRVPQTESSGGVLLAIDGQPDGTVARRRYWRGNFLFAEGPALGSPGFKRFRPVVKDGRVLRALTNDEIKSHPDYGDYSLEQYEGGVDAFYDKMDEILSPTPRSAEVAMLETIAALEEQVRGRVLSVQNGQKFIQKNPEVIEMPEGPSIFETTGPWEDFSTPSRDLRLLIAIDIVRSFPERVEKRPERFAMPAGSDAARVRADLERTLARELGSRNITYERSDGSPVSLSLADVVARADALEMAYNPNDCVEVRWGAPEKSPESATCRRRAPADQRSQMRKYRAWFHERRRPPRM